VRRQERARKPAGEPPTAAPFVPRTRNLAALRKAARRCRGCHLFEDATQTVFGAGAARAKILFIGEQPGNEEDLAGAPFVGPAGRLFDEALAAAGLDRKSVWVTNAVKHFKWEPRGKRRLHKKPSSREVAACRPWLMAELDAIRPVLVVCLGATAAQAVLGAAFRVSQSRGRLFDSELGPKVMATVHPSSVLRAPDPERRRADRAAFFADMKAIAATAARLERPQPRARS
jgi:DNA polymerase